MTLTECSQRLTGPATFLRMTRLLNYFLRGLVVVVPLALTVYVCVEIFTTIDSWLGLPIRGVGFLLTLVLITLVGVLASGIVTRSLLSAVDRVFDRLPFVRLLYSSAKDMLNAFVGEKRRFDKPVLVAVTGDKAVKVIAFLIRQLEAEFTRPAHEQRVFKMIERLAEVDAAERTRSS